MEAGEICSPPSEILPYDFEIYTDDVISKIQRIHLPFLNLTNNHISLRFNDIGNDGYPDLIIDGGYNQTFLLKNEKCSNSNECGSFYNPKFT